jgi:transposase
MERFIGLDIHRRSAEACILDAAGKVVERCSIACTRQALSEFARSSLLPTDSLALEATTHCWAVAALLKPHVARALVSNPLLTKAIAQAKVKTDKVDAKVLGQLLRADYLPLVWQPDPETLRLRTLSSRRSALVSERTRLKNRIHSVLFSELVPPPQADLFSKKGQQWLAALELPSESRALIESDLRLLEAADRELEAISLEIAKKAGQDQRARLLMTLPGVDITTAVGLLAAIGDFSRFRSPDRLAAYLGLVPSTRASADKCFHGPITKRGNSGARWLLIQAAQHLRLNPGPLGAFYRRLRRKKNHNVAVVACARKMATIVWHMLTHNEPYRYAQPRITDEKLARLRILTSGEKRKTGPKKGTPPSANRGTGKRERTEPALPEVYAEAGLPEAKGPDEVAPAERRALERAGVAEYARGIRSPRRVLRVRKAPPTAGTDTPAPDAAPTARPPAKKHGD